MTDPLTIIHGDALSSLRALPDESVQCCVTSPPYWGLRDYGTGEWIGGNSDCDHAMKQGQRQDSGRGNHNGGMAGFHGGAHTELSKRYYRGVCGKCGADRVDIQLGLETTPEEYVARLVEIFRELKRVLRSDGTLWLNLGDSYASQAGGYSDNGSRGATAQISAKTQAAVLSHKTRRPPEGLKPKDLVGIPWMVAFALRADGWYLRSDIIWSKPNPMPESVTDRPTKSHEYIFLLSKSERYYYDADAIKEPPSGSSHGGGRENAARKTRVVHGEASHKGLTVAEPAGQEGRNRRSVWNVATSPFPDAHFATFPTDLVRPCVLAGTSARGSCSACGASWRRDIQREANYGRREIAHAPRSAPSKVDSSEWKPATVTDRGWVAGCCCDESVTPCLVLDPFAGSGTTGKVAIELGRKAILIEPKAEYIEMIKRRCQTTMGLPLAI